MSADHENDDWSDAAAVVVDELATGVARAVTSIRTELLDAFGRSTVDLDDDDEASDEIARLETLVDELVQLVRFTGTEAPDCEAMP